MVLRIRQLIPMLALCVAALHTSQTDADAVDRSIAVSKDNIHEEQHTQKHIDRLSDETRAMLDEYQALNHELDGLKVYNEQMQRLIRSQEEEKQAISKQVQGIALTRQQLVPLMLRMIEQLKSSIHTDLPFLPAERTRRVQQLTELMDRADVSLSEKYRRILGAYRIELDYGRTLEAYRQELVVGGATRTVDILRVGRIGLYYQTLDRKNAAYWDQQRQTWVAVDATLRRAIQRGLRIAGQQLAPELLELPVAAAGPDNE